ncbi:hypothetical protein MM221_08120 [Salipaludibacillus sp. LMS25]|jgi:hypothetical protein|uniref:hypothetical protein n=1 Tax=Salipaludibacillus sp. LMS25 TaxID=2924031 RepID=UPI0020D09F7A|nr:hypothetical protein [Salipaludibacillus sp. LMS25]UTR16497.1 hypothetical protein MM221_08120 [Salipaludibacillus sp. LMS25]
MFYIEWSFKIKGKVKGVIPRGSATSEDPMMRKVVWHHLAEGESWGKRPSVAEDHCISRFLQERLDEDIVRLLKKK